MIRLRRPTRRTATAAVVLAAVLAGLGAADAVAAPKHLSMAPKHLSMAPGHVTATVQAAPKHL